MPPRLYNKHTKDFYESEEEMLRLRKIRDNQKNKIRYYRQKYKYDLTLEDYEEFNKNVPLIKNIYDIHNYFINFDPKNEVKHEHLDIYINKHKYIFKALPIQNYVRTLKKIDDDLDNDLQNNKYILEF